MQPASPWPAGLRAQVAQQLAPFKRWILAFSAGKDSSSLAHLLASIDPSRCCFVHVNHHWNAQSNEWQSRAAQISTDLGIEFHAISLELTSSEAEARAKRYEALERFVGTADALITAHHFDDQLETLMWRIRQGRPPRAMPETRPFGAGTLVRPLLTVWKRALPIISNHVTDPSNSNAEYFRVRQRQLRGATTAYDKDLFRLSTLWNRIETLVPVPEALEPAGATVESLSLWLWRYFNLPAPPRARLASLLTQLPSKPDRQPRIEWQVGDARWVLGVYRQQFWIDLAELSGLEGVPWPNPGELHAMAVPPWLRRNVRLLDDGRCVWWRARVEKNGHITLEAQPLKL